MSESSPEAHVDEHAPIHDSERVAVLQVAVTALSELLRQDNPHAHTRFMSCLQQTRDLPQNVTYSHAFDELLNLLDNVQR